MTADSCFCVLSEMRDVQKGSYAFISYVLVTATWQLLPCPTTILASCWCRCQIIHYCLVSDHYIAAKYVDSALSLPQSLSLVPQEVVCGGDVSTYCGNIDRVSCPSASSKDCWTVRLIHECWNQHRYICWGFRRGSACFWQRRNLCWHGLEMLYLMPDFFVKCLVWVCPRSSSDSAFPSRSGEGNQHCCWPDCGSLWNQQGSRCEGKSCFSYAFLPS